MSGRKRRERRGGLSLPGLLRMLGSDSGSAEPPPGEAGDQWPPPGQSWPGGDEPSGGTPGEPSGAAAGAAAGTGETSAEATRPLAAAGDQAAATGEPAESGEGAPGGLSAVGRGAWAWVTGPAASEAAPARRSAGAESGAESGPGSAGVPPRGTPPRPAMPGWATSGLRYWREHRVFRWSSAAVAVVLVAGVFLLYSSTHQGKQITAYFSQTVGVYKGSDVRVLGVQVGSVTAVHPEGSRVAVTMTVDHGIAIPAGADALVVSPSVVADRYVQLTPAYTGGPQIADGAVIPMHRTATPVEVDQLYASLNKLATAFGPHGANAHGALSDALKTGAANLSGNGKALGDMITQFGRAMGTLGRSSGNLYSTVRNLQQFTSMLKNNDGQVRQIEQQLSQVTGFLSDDRQNLTAALDELATALGQVKTFISGNRALIKTNVTRLAAITGLLVKERASLAQALDTAPLAADNLLGAYDPVHHTLDGRGDLNEFTMGPSAISVNTGGGSGTSASVTSAVLFAVPPSQVAGLPPLPLPTVGTVYGTPLSASHSPGSGAGGR